GSTTSTVSPTPSAWAEKDEGRRGRDEGETRGRGDGEAARSMLRHSPRHPVTPSPRLSVSPSVFILHPSALPCRKFRLNKSPGWKRMAHRFNPFFPKDDP